MILEENMRFLEVLYMDQVYRSILHLVTRYAFATRETFKHKHFRPFNKISGRFEKWMKVKF